jgi:hypothetical protein
VLWEVQIVHETKEEAMGWLPTCSSQISRVYFLGMEVKRLKTLANLSLLKAR